MNKEEKEFHCHILVFKSCIDDVFNSEIYKCRICELEFITDRVHGLREYTNKEKDLVCGS